MTETNTKKQIIWADTEFTGLKFPNEKLLEIGMLITDYDFNVLSKPVSIVIHQDFDVLDNMDPWCIKQHGKTGLTKESLESNIDEKQAEQMLLEYLVTNGIEKRQAALAGNSIFQDRAYINKYMPDLEQYFHYRNIDVSSFKEMLLGNEIKSLFRPFVKDDKDHRVLSDIQNSINELKYYMARIKFLVRFLNSAILETHNSDVKFGELGHVHVPSPSFNPSFHNTERCLIDEEFLDAIKAFRHAFDKPSDGNKIILDSYAGSIKDEKGFVVEDKSSDGVKTFLDSWVEPPKDEKKE